MNQRCHGVGSATSASIILGFYSIGLGAGSERHSFRYTLHMNLSCSGTKGPNNVLKAKVEIPIGYGLEIIYALYMLVQMSSI